MTVKDLITRLLDEPMNADVILQTDYDKPIESCSNNVRCVTSGVFFSIDSIEHWASNCILINFTDWRKDGVTEDLDTAPSAKAEIIRCKKCRYKKRKGVDYYCDHITGEEIMVSPNDYCSWAERGTDG